LSFVSGFSAASMDVRVGVQIGPGISPVCVTVLYPARSAGRSAGSGAFGLSQNTYVFQLATGIFASWSVSLT
jgi:K+-transporting ATPase A subunit